MAQPQASARISTVLLTPEMATKLLEHNSQNRPLSQAHANRIAKAITEGRWKFNGDTIKIADNDDILDGQHRCWAVVEANKPVETIIVRGVARDAFATIDTIRKMRTGGDTLSLAGVTRHRNTVSTALTWLLRWQAKRPDGTTAIEDFKQPGRKIENAHIEEAFSAHPNMVNAVERARGLRGLGNVGVLAFIFYVLHNRNAALAERMMETLEDPAAVAKSDPFFLLRQFLLSGTYRQRDAVMTIAIAFKAASAAHKGEKPGRLLWINQGAKRENFPKLAVG